MRCPESTLSIFLILLLFAAGSAWAQEDPPRRMARADSMAGPGQGMMQSGMMRSGMMGMMRGMHQQMMQNPMHRNSMMAFMLPALADTLDLSSQQVRTIERLRSELKAQRRTNQKEMRMRCDEFMALFDEGESLAAGTIRENLRSMATMSADHRAAMYETAQEMREVLTSEQRQMVSELSPQQTMRLLMANMPMRDIMQMRQSMRGNMMGGCMGRQNMQMGQRMMQQRGMMQNRQNMPNQQNR